MMKGYMIYQTVSLLIWVIIAAALVSIAISLRKNT